MNSGQENIPKDNKRLEPSFPQFAKNENEAKSKSNLIEIPSITLPKGGGAIKSIDEKFQVNPSNGTASFSIPFPVSQARGYVPTIELSYNSGAGNSPFGLGWSLGIPSIKRKTDKKLPQYRDNLESDTFMFSGAEDLVIVAGQQPNALTKLYRPRVESGFARIEKINTAGKNYWKVTSKENVVSIFGLSKSARITNPEDQSQIFEWFLEFSYNDQGHCMQYHYQQEDRKNVLASVFEQNRGKNLSPITNAYLTQIFYANKTPWYQEDHALDQLPPLTDYLLSIEFDYGAWAKVETPHDEQVQNKWVSIQKQEEGWSVRLDPFSEYRAGFEVRTYRLCQRILQFHHFEELEKNPYLVRSMEFSYQQPEYEGASNDSSFRNDCAYLSYLNTITQCGYIWNEGKAKYTQKSLPPLTFTYETASVFSKDYVPEVKTLAPDHLKNLPIGIDEKRYAWTDLFSEGISGVLTEQGEGWYYKENLGGGEFSPARLIMSRPSFGGIGTTLQLQDLESNGMKQVVVHSPGVNGFYEIAPHALIDTPNHWQPFRTFRQYPNFNTSDQNVKFLDLDGDGKTEILISEHNAFVVYEGMGKDGYGPEFLRIAKPRDEEHGPNIVFADQTQSILLADMSGDGMMDIVRLRNGEVCYWPNLGYGRFGAKVTMANPPWLDHAESFNPRFVKLADIDGTGTTDIIYLARNEFKLWYNLGGNAWSKPTTLLNVFPNLDTESEISVIDFLGNGTSCIVWSSSLPQHANCPLRYIDLCGGKKPHVLINYQNNLGKEVSITYRSSTSFYLEDKRNGRPWVTKLTFPVQCVSQTEIRDHISGTYFVQKYSYRHGYYDPIEREFRGFAYVEQSDSEAYEDYKIGVPLEGTMSGEKAFFQAPIITKSWFHTGAFFEKKRIVHFLKQEYWPQPLLSHTNADDPALLKAAQMWELPEPEIPADWTADEAQEAGRALKGRLLRQEVYSNEGDLDQQQHPYSVAQHSYAIQRIQAKADRPYASFFVLEKENLSGHYERNPADPRITHSMNIREDEWGNVLQSAAIVYGRKVAGSEITLLEDHQAQSTHHITFTENTVSEAKVSPSVYRGPITCASITWELVIPKPANRPFNLAEIEQQFKLATIVDYSIQAQNGQKRKLEHNRTLFWKDDLSGFLPFKEQGQRALKGESYLLAFTEAMLPGLFGNKVNKALLLSKEAAYIDLMNDGTFWIGSGKVYAYPDLSAQPNVSLIPVATAADFAYAKANFFMPVAFADNFGHLSKVQHDPYHLFIQKMIDPLGNETRVQLFNYRTLTPALTQDPNQNRAGVRFDELGMVVRTFVMGKTNQQLGDFMDENALESSPLDRPTSQLEYEFRYTPAQKMPNRVMVKLREKHHFQEKTLLNGGLLADAGALAVNAVESNVVWQTSYSYSDGSGHEVLKKIPAEPGKAPVRTAEGKLQIANGEVLQEETNQPRWIGTGRTILNNKGNPVKQYEPFFDSSPEYNYESELVMLGFTPLLFYDAPGRLIRTQKPDGTFSRVEFDAWQQRIFDENDTAGNSPWHQERINGAKGAAEQRCAEKTTLHHNTPTVIHLDSQARPFLMVAHNKTKRRDEAQIEEKFYTRTSYDLEGNVLKVSDARGNEVMTWQYDMLGNICVQQSMDAGVKYQLYNAKGNPLRNWDNRNHTFSYTYDALHRPLSIHVAGGDDPNNVLDHVFERFEYGEQVPNASLNNLRGKPWRHYDSASLVENPMYDYKGNALLSTRQLCRNYQVTPNWSVVPPPAGILEVERHATAQRFDALSRPIESRYPDESLYLAQYNEASLLESVQVHLRGAAVASPFIQNIDYNAKGQRERIQYANGTTTRYDYEPETYQLKRLLSTADNGTRSLQDLNYTYDPIGNVSEIYDNAQKTVFYGGEKVEARREFWYDALYRLTEATGREMNGLFDPNRSQDNWDDPWAKQAVAPGGQLDLRYYTQLYTYDEVGNIKIMEHRHRDTPERWTRRNTYSSSNNHLLSTTVGATHHDYNSGHYNAHGSLQKMSHLSKITWNFKEEMSFVQVDANKQVWYIYDSSGQRIRKLVHTPGNRVEERIYLGNVEIFRRRTLTGALIFQRDTLHVMDDKQRIALVETRVLGNDDSPVQLTRYQYTDHLGTACLELDAGVNGQNARVISYEEYHPYGTTAYQAMNSEIRALAKRYRYTGMERDEETGLNYHGARYYVPWLARWTQRDRIEKINGYLYVNNSPIRFLDPDGNSESEGANRFWGGMRMLGGAGQLLLGGLALVAPEPTMATKVIGTIAVVNGADDFTTGFRQLVSGQQERGAIESTVTVTAEAAGMSHENAEALGTGTSMALGFVSPSGPMTNGPRALPALARATSGEVMLVTATADLTRVADNARGAQLAANGIRAGQSMMMSANNESNSSQDNGSNGSTASTTPDSSQIPPEYFDEALSRIDEGGLNAAGAHLPDLTSHAQSSAARAERGLATQSAQSAHISARSAMRNVAGYDPRAALTRLLDSTAHRGFDDYWKRVFRQIANTSGQNQISVRDYFNTMRDAIGNNPHFSNAEANSMVELLRDELFVQHGLQETDMLRLPYSR